MRICRGFRSATATSITTRSKDNPSTSPGWRLATTTYLRRGSSAALDRKIGYEQPLVGQVPAEPAGCQSKNHRPRDVWLRGKQRKQVTARDRRRREGDVPEWHLAGGEGARKSVLVQR